MTKEEKYKFLNEKVIKLKDYFNLVHIKFFKDIGILIDNNLYSRMDFMFCRLKLIEICSNKKLLKNRLNIYNEILEIFDEIYFEYS